jgi:hypothetical protein
MHMKNGLNVNNNGAKHWYLHGQRHREDGPALEWANGHKEWWLHGERHREDGPAVEFANDDKAWYLNGEEFTKDNYLLKTSKFWQQIID